MPRVSTSPYGSGQRGALFTRRSPHVEFCVYSLLLQKNACQLPTSKLRLSDDPGPIERRIRVPPSLPRVVTILIVSYRRRYFGKGDPCRNHYRYLTVRHMNKLPTKAFSLPQPSWTKAFNPVDTSVATASSTDVILTSIRSRKVASSLARAWSSRGRVVVLV